jgi:hypothetical protein
MSIIDPQSPLTPSELVLLNGERFAKKVMLGNISLLHSDASVSVAQLGQAILAAAFLTNEQQGAIRLEKRKKKAMLGLRKVEVLYALAGARDVTWPAPSLEADVLSVLARSQKDDEWGDISNIIYAWLREDSTSPWQSAIELIKSGMASRGMLEKFEEKKLKIFTSIRYELPQSTLNLSKEYPIEPVEALLRACENNRPEIWKLLIDQIKSAIKARTEQDQDTSDF